MQEAGVPGGAMIFQTQHPQAEVEQNREIIKRVGKQKGPGLSIKDADKGLSKKTFHLNVRGRYGNIIHNVDNPVHPTTEMEFFVILKKLKI